MTISDEVWVLVVDIDCSVDRFHGRSVPHFPDRWRLRVPRARGRQTNWRHREASGL